MYVYSSCGSHLCDRLCVNFRKFGNLVTWNYPMTFSRTYRESFSDRLSIFPLLQVSNSNTINYEILYGYMTKKVSVFWWYFIRTHINISQDFVVVKTFIFRVYNRVQWKPYKHCSKFWGLTKKVNSVFYQFLYGFDHCLIVNKVEIKGSTFPFSVNVV